MSETLTTLQNLFTFAFVVSSMLGMGLALTLDQILQPLRNARLVVVALIANFVIVPAVAIVLSRLIPMDEQLQIGVILFGSAAGAPFLPKLAQIAKASVGFSVGLMALLIVVTVAFLPILLPLVLPGVSVDARLDGRHALRRDAGPAGDRPSRPPAIPRRRGPDLTADRPGREL